MRLTAIKAFVATCIYLTIKLRYRSKEAIQKQVSIIQNKWSIPALPRNRRNNSRQLILCQSPAVNIRDVIYIKSSYPNET
jgi:hypothetical protein